MLANLLAHIGFIVFDKINMKYRIINYAVMLVYLIGIILGFGFLFDWFAVNEIWIVCVVGVIVFVLAIVMDIIKINRDAKEINASLDRLRNRIDNNDKTE